MNPLDPRQSRRHTTLTEAKLVINNVSLGSVEVVDLSEGGAGLILGRAFEPGDKGHITLWLAQNEKKHLLQAECQVANCQVLNPQHYHIGLQFTRFLQTAKNTQHLLRQWQTPVQDNPPGVERRQQSYLDLTHATMRSLAEILSSSDPRARSAASRAMQSLKQMEAAIPKRRRKDVP